MTTCGELWHNTPHMDASELLDAEVKARVPEAQKERLQAIARSRHLKVADIVREAIREKIGASEELPVPAGTEVAS